MFEASTFNVFIILMLIFGIWVFILWKNTGTMHKQIKQVAQQQSFIRQDEAVRKLCRAIHNLHPSLHAGIDYIVHSGGPGQKPHIANWMHSSIPQPTDEQLERSMMEISDVDPVKDHAAQRLREYPSVGDQLDAAYKARHGDTDDQVRLDAQIQAIKQKYPKSDDSL
jgi:hypothetical protein